ncbi:MAG: metalloregulator ArsR/SmtB family transcription factor [Kineosporiaceae bacterium]
MHADMAHVVHDLAGTADAVDSADVVDSAHAADHPDVVERAVEVFRLLSDGTRVRIVRALIDGELSVGVLAEQVARPPATVSQHLAKLRAARLVRTRREGTTVHYRLDSGHVARLVTDALHHAEHAGAGVPPHHRDPGAAPRTVTTAGGRS